MKDGISVRRLAGRRVRVTATQGAVTTEAVFTMAEVQELYRKLGEYLAAPALRGAQGGGQ